MNRSVKILLLLTLLAALAWWFVSNRMWSTMKSDKKDFAITDTASITRFFLANKRGQQVLLEKNEQGIWMVNGTTPADEQKINLLKATLHDVQVRNPITESEYNTVVARMASDAVKTEIYAGNKRIQTLYVGQATADGTGTYMMIEQASSPYITHIPGFVGYLSPRFSANPVKWKSKIVFDYQPADIAHVKVSYPQNESLSFMIENGSQPVVRNHKGEVLDADPGFVQFYLASFSNLAVEAYDEDLKQEQKDSISATPVFCSIAVESKTKPSHTLRLHLKAIDQRTKERYDDQGNLLEYDYDKYFGFIDREKDLVYVQQYNFGRIIKNQGDFIQTKTTLP